MNLHKPTTVTRMPQTRKITYIDPIKKISSKVKSVTNSPVKASARMIRLMKEATPLPLIESDAFYSSVYDFTDIS